MTDTACYAYVWTISRNVNGIWDESGPSPVSPYVTNIGKRIVNRPFSNLFAPRTPTVKCDLYGLEKVVGSEYKIIGFTKDAMTGDDIVTFDTPVITGHEVEDGRTVGVLAYADGIMKAVANDVTCYVVPASASITSPVQTLHDADAANPGFTIAGGEQFKIYPLVGYYPGSIDQKFISGSNPCTQSVTLLPALSYSSTKKWFHLTWGAAAGASGYMVCFKMAGAGTEYIVAYVPAGCCEYYATGLESMTAIGIQRMGEAYVRRIPHGLIKDTSFRVVSEGLGRDYNGGGYDNSPPHRVVNRPPAWYGYIVTAPTNGVALTTRVHTPVGQPISVSVNDLVRFSTGTTNVIMDGLLPYPTIAKVTAVDVGNRVFTIEACIAKECTETTTGDMLSPTRYVEYGLASAVVNENLKWNIYRTGDGLSFMRVADRLAWDITLWNDETKDSDIFVEIPTYYTDSAGITVLYSNPPEDLTGLCEHAARWWGITGEAVCWTPTNRPDAWPVLYRRSFNGSKPRRLIPTTGGLLVLCDNSIWLGHPVSDGMVQWAKVQSGSGVVAPFTARNTPMGVIFLSDAGLVCYSPSTGQMVKLLSDKLGKQFYQSAYTGFNPSFQHWLFPSAQGHAYTFQALANKLGGPVNPAIQAQILSGAIPQPITHLMSVYSDKRYYLYSNYRSGSNLSPMGVLCVDLAHDDPVLTTMNLRPIYGDTLPNGRMAWLFPHGDSYSQDTAAQQAAASQETLEPTDANNVAGINGLAYATYGYPGGTPAVYLHDPAAIGLAGSTVADGWMLMRLRTGKIQPNGANRSTWNHIDFHGTGRVWTAFYMDGFRIPETGWAQAEASETATDSRRIPMPIGLTGYSLDIDMVTEGELLAIEMDIDPERGA